MGTPSQSLDREPICSSIYLTKQRMKTTNTTTKMAVLPATLTLLGNRCQQFAVLTLAMMVMMVCQSDVKVIVVNAEPTACPNDASIQGYSDKTILNQDLQANSDGTGTYIICPGTTIRFTGDDPTSINVFGSNGVTIQCGTDGSSSNNCIFELAGSSVNPLMAIYADNTIIQGLTFTEDSSSAAVEYSSSVCSVNNSTIFRDCHFQNFNANTSSDPMISIDVLIPIEEPPGRRSVLFDTCSFRNNPSSFNRARLISVTDEKDHVYDLTVQNTVFESSSASVATIGVDGSSGLITVTDTVFRCGGQFSNARVIDAAGSATIQSSCFVEMNVENAYVQAYSSSSTDVQSSATDTSYVRPLNANTQCRGISVWAVEDGDMDQCVEFTAADSCPMTGQDSSPCPTQEPTNAPTETPPAPSGAMGVKATKYTVQLISFLLVLKAT